jgi:hypothetical protein
VLVVVTVRRSTIGEENHDLMNRLWVLGEIVLNEQLSKRSANTRQKWTNPEHVGILEMGLRVPLLRVNEVRELGRVAKEEDRGIVEDPVPVSFLCSKLDREATGIPSTICRATLASNSGETNGGANLLANLLEEGLGGDIAQVVSDLEVAMGTSSFGVDLVQMSISYLAISVKSLLTTRSGIRSRSK